MEVTNCRGQCALEALMVLMVLTTVVLLTQQFAVMSKSFFTGAVLSKEGR